ncbi:hypothetical protein JTB14_033159 [Gonioctena quinquepunctata]|nr:hypothetical protein JTB14_033159 [Gonioctena quinquepunctata]
MRVALVLVLLVSLFYITVGIQVQHHTHSAAKGFGDHGKHSSDQSHKSGDESSSKHDVEKKAKGQKFKSLHATEDEEGAGKKSQHHSETSHSSFKKDGGKSKHGLKFQEGSGRKKFNFKKGYNEKYHKDESTKHDSFFSNADKTGEYEVFGQKHSKYKNPAFEKKNQGKHKKSGSSNAHGRSSKKAGGHNEQDHRGHQGQSGSKSHHKHASQHGKKSSSHGGKQYHFSDK